MVIVTELWLIATLGRSARTDQVLRSHREAIMTRLSVVAIALVLVLATGCSSHEEMQEIQQKCNGGDKDACAQLRPVPILPRPGPG
jgi:hypothetical protein